MKLEKIAIGFCSVAMIICLLTAGFLLNYGINYQAREAALKQEVQDYWDNFYSEYQVWSVEFDYQAQEQHNKDKVVY
jgi:hypothetical protein